MEGRTQGGGIRGQRPRGWRRCGGRGGTGGRRPSRGPAKGGEAQWGGEVFGSEPLIIPTTTPLTVFGQAGQDGMEGPPPPGEAWVMHRERGFGAGSSDT